MDATAIPRLDTAASFSGVKTFGQPTATTTSPFVSTKPANVGIFSKIPAAAVYGTKAQVKPFDWTIPNMPTWPPVVQAIGGPSLANFPKGTNLTSAAPTSTTVISEPATGFTNVPTPKFEPDPEFIKKMVQEGNFSALTYEELNTLPADTLEIAAINLIPRWERFAEADELQGEYNHINNNFQNLANHKVFMNTLCACGDVERVPQTPPGEPPGWWESIVAEACATPLPKKRKDWPKFMKTLGLKQIPGLEAHVLNRKPKANVQTTTPKPIMDSPATIRVKQDLAATAVALQEIVNSLEGAPCERCLRIGRLYMDVKGEEHKLCKPCRKTSALVLTRVPKAKAKVPTPTTPPSEDDELPVKVNWTEEQQEQWLAKKAKEDKVVSKPTTPTVVRQSVQNIAKISEQRGLQKHPLGGFKTKEAELQYFLAKEEERIFAIPALVAQMREGKSSKFGNRAGAKFNEMQQWFNLPNTPGKTALDLCAAPGGATKLLLHKGYRVVAVTHPDGFKLFPELVNNKEVDVHMEDILKTTHFESHFVKKKPQIVFADGAVPGLECGSIDQESQNFDLLVMETKLILRNCAREGSAVLKFFSGLTEDTRVIIGNLSEAFAEWDIIKPDSSRPGNAELYFVGRGFKPSLGNKILNALNAKNCFNFSSLVRSKILKLAENRLKFLQSMVYLPPVSLTAQHIQFKHSIHYNKFKAIADARKAKWGDRFCIPDVQCGHFLREMVTNYKLAKATEDNWFYELHTKLAERYNKLQPLRTYQNFPMKIHQAVTGAGKTVEIEKKFDPWKDRFICPFNKLRDDFTRAIREKFPKATHDFAFTMDNALLRGDWASVRNVYVDEMTCLPIQWYILLMTLSPQAVIHLSGDVHQTGYMDKYGYMSANAAIIHWTEFLPAPKVSLETRRFSAVICDLLQNVCAYEIYPAKDSRFTRGDPPTKLTRSGMDDRIMDADLNIAYTNKTKKHLMEMNIQCSTVKACQGQSVQKVNLFMSNSKGDRDLYSVRELNIVALSRASHHLNIVDADVGTLNNIGWGLEVIPLNHEITTGLPFVPPTHVVEMHPLFEPPKKEVIGKDAEFDAHVLETSLPGEGLDLRVQKYAFDFSSPLSRSVISAGAIVKTTPELKRRLTYNAYGKAYTSSPQQSYFTALNRMANSSSTKGMMSMQATRSVADAARKKFLRDDIDFELFHMRLGESVMKVFDKYKKSGRLKDLEPIDYTVHGIIRMFIKAQTKIKDDMDQAHPGWEKLDPAKVNTVFGNKAGQPILAWATELNTAFCAFFRTMESMLIDSLKPEFIYANGLNDQQIEDALNGLPPWMKALCCDVSEYDSRQQVLTQEAEYVWFQMLCPNSSLDDYYHFRRGMRVVNNIISFYSGTKKSSGEPATLYANTTLIMIVMFLLCPTMIAGIFKGDDSCCFFKEATPPTPNIHVASKLINCEFKQYVTQIPEFCSYIYGGGTWVYNMKTWAKKLLDRNYSIHDKVAEREHQDYKLATLDKLRLVGETGSERYKDVVALHSAHTGASGAIVETWLEQARAFTLTPWNHFKSMLVTMDPDVSNRY